MFLVVAAVLGVVLGVWLAGRPAPAPQSPDGSIPEELPSGHPDINMSYLTGELPSGHPDIDMGYPTPDPGAAEPSTTLEPSPEPDPPADPAPTETGE
jgi:hypothetical protein